MQKTNYVNETFIETTSWNEMGFHDYPAKATKFFNLSFFRCFLPFAAAATLCFLAQWEREWEVEEDDS